MSLAGHMKYLFISYHLIFSDTSSINKNLGGCLNFKFYINLQLRSNEGTLDYAAWANKALGAILSLTHVILLMCLSIWL